MERISSPNLFHFRMPNFGMDTRAERVLGALSAISRRVFCLRILEGGVPRDTLLERVCGYDYIGETNVIDVYIRYLRTKIDDAFDVKMIQTVRGVGYVIKSEPGDR